MSVVGRRPLGVESCGSDCAGGMGRAMWAHCDRCAGTTPAGSVPLFERAAQFSTFRIASAAACICGRRTARVALLGRTAAKTKRREWKRVLARG